MAEWLQWFGRFENSKILALLLFFITFCGVLIYVYTGKKRSARLESYKYIPLQDDEQDTGAGSGEEQDNERRES
ncbi:MAG: cbb3-type cytochrome c oxidase subunit 3 [Anaerolineales bacterium]|jgi:cbb3-type cytochrome oxidase subunit 3